MQHFVISDPPYFSEQSPPVKTEASASPDLLAPTISSIHKYQFKIHPPTSTSSHGSLPSPRQPSEPPSLPQNHIYRFGSASGYNLMSNHSSWSPSPTASHNITSTSSRVENGGGKFELDSAPHTMTYPDDFDDSAELVEISETNQLDLPSDLQTTSINTAEKHIRRRSSKACDQCRKSKCKCERPSPEEPCKSCVMLGTPCTFLGPSRKRGPPKGYIDAIEARLHQTEALLGIMISASDIRAQTLLRDIGKDPLAKEIINRVDNSPYGAKGRRQDGDVKPRSTSHAPSCDSSTKSEFGKIDLTNTHPSNEWQDRVSSMLSALEHTSRSSDTEDIHYSVEKSNASSLNSRNPNQLNRSISLGDHEDISLRRRIRRRLGTEDFPFHSDHARDGSIAPSQRNNSPLSQGGGYPDTHSPYSGSRRRSSVSSVDSVHPGSDEDLNGAAGQLSLNEDEQVRYHGNASGLYLLGNKERVDGRNEGGIWRFPKARVWPPLSSSSSTRVNDDEYVNQLPDQHVQEHLIDVYFKHVHINLPVIHKRSFFDAFRAEQVDSPQSQPSASPFNRGRRRVPSLLLFAMFAIAARHTENTPKPSDSTTMWEAGDEYLDQAKVILDATYAASRPSTCQALLLMGYREIGIGAMAQAWTYIGMAIRMAQDLGMHRSADGWARAELGGRLFGDWELHERKRIWYTCLLMDVYVSTYIGRPLMINERDFDTPLPSDDDPEEIEDWVPSSVPENNEMPAAVSSRTISCFNASAKLAGILASIVQAIYAIRRNPSRHSDAQFFEGLLDKWYIGLPECLRYEVGSKRATAPPHVLTLHMQYWCTVLLLHRPFIHNSPRNDPLQEFDDVEAQALAEKSFELCAGAANHITSLATIYSEAYTLDHCANFLCYYVFTASLMHFTILTTHPADPQARMGLSRCMDILRLMEVLWPSAARALELLRGAKENVQDSATPIPARITSQRRKRPAEKPLEDSGTLHRVAPPDHHSLHHEYLELRAPYTSQYVSHAAYTPNGEIRTHDSHSSAPVPCISSSFDRWPSENNNSHSFGFPETLSTSVLPQLYSTGLVDDRNSHHIPHRSNGHHPTSTQPRINHTTARYPQYWNDFSTFPQLGTAYGGYHEPSSASQQQHSASSHMYLSESYNIYNQSR